MPQIPTRAIAIPAIATTKVTIAKSTAKDDSIIDTQVS